MNKLSRQDLMSLEEYAEQREGFRAQVMAHKKQRRVALGGHLALYFEDRLTIQYQIQEMLRVEKLFEKAAIEEELMAYNPLIPDGTNWKATMMIEFDDPAQRRRALIEMKGIEECVWTKIGNEQRIWAIADEDLERSNEEKTSAVHFLRFEIPVSQIAALKAGAALFFGVEHLTYCFSCEILPPVRERLVADLT
ncbi:MAG: hypothetical protein RIT27_1866 [Pseudomonadota bacterium]|jgi:hypothetical protein